MADDVDRATALIEADLQARIAAARVPIPAGEPGECDDCGDDSPRLVGGRCAWCRDERAKRRAA